MRSGKKVLLSSPLMEVSHGIPIGHRSGDLHDQVRSAGRADVGQLHAVSGPGGAVCATGAGLTIREGRSPSARQGMPCSPA